MKVAPGIDIGGLPERKGVHALRQFGDFRHRRAVNQNRNDGRATRERGLDFNANPIRWFENTRIPALVRGQPIRTNDREQDVAPTEHAAQVIAKIDPERNSVDVDKDISLAEITL